MKNQLTRKVCLKLKLRSLSIMVLSLFSLTSYGQNNPTDTSKSVPSLLNHQPFNQKSQKPQLLLLSSKPTTNEKEESIELEASFLEILSLQSQFVSDFTLVTINSPVSDEFAKIRILNFTGQTLIEEIFQLRIGQVSYPIQLNNLPIGLYSIQIIANGVIISNNLLKQ